MYSWTLIRSVSAVLLLIPIIHLALLVSRETLDTMNTSPQVWADEVEAYRQADQRTQLPTDPVVIVGGRRVGLWRDLEDLLAPMHVLNRSLGDATTRDIKYFYQRLIGYYRPHSVILFPGESEFRIRENNNAEELTRTITTLVETDLKHGVTRRFYVIPPLKTPLYPTNNATIDETTRALHAWAQNVPQVVILDANKLLSDREGNAKPGYFRSDGVNLNEHGYVRLSILLRSRFEQDNPEIYASAGAT